MRRQMQEAGFVATAERQPPKGNAPVERVLNLLDEVKPCGHGWSALCPCHGDKNPSLSVGVGEDGRVLVHCHAGCDTRVILDEMGLTWRDLFPTRKWPRREGGKRHAKSPPTAQLSAESSSCTLRQYSQTKRLKRSFLRKLGVRECSYLGQPALRIPYYDEDGQEVAVRFRIALSKAPEGDNRFQWRKGDKALPYGLWRLTNARRAKRVALVEGESDCHTLWSHGVAAVGIPGANSWNERWAEYFGRVDTILVIVEPDRGGEAVLKSLANSSIRDRVRIIRLKDAKDPSDLHVASPPRFSKRWRKAVKDSISWQEHERLLASRQSEAAWKECAELALRTDILRGVTKHLKLQGVVGENRLVKLIYLAVTGRLLDRPPCVAVRGPSSGGKSYVSEQTLRLFPPEAFFVLTAMSQRALAYSSEPLRHRTLVLYEAAGLQGEMGDYLLRSLLSEGRVRYLTVEKGKNGFVPRLIEREGPTGLLITTTKLHLHPENETRLLSVAVNDSADQTRRVLLAHAVDRKVVSDIALWHALQRWLEGAEHRIAVPYAEALAARIPATAVRMRRDFPHLLSFIRAHALLHQATRPRDESGYILATLDDYDAVKALLNDVLSEGLETTVAPSVRETVQAVAALCKRGLAGVQLSDIAAQLKLDKSTTSRRVRVAIERGYLANEEERRGHPMRVTLGNPMPGGARILPDLSRLTQVVTRTGRRTTRSAG